MTAVLEVGEDQRITRICIHQS